ncbi:glycerol-3-phosphate responsive antiterminator [Fodinisporobacter ferrooxydans]|uniref:Glycerol uptake operon antiterminator regulatory protein n=1 Tax=Fodinisporobacter ferrooxydans TaxID=2901836 RepID=A0ABY4CUP4_9BACL|nr:glycerol-3-phosphate responsive antiterminator [Alicyclobacillaceae bacterium MYW30-H2]
MTHFQQQQIIPAARKVKDFEEVLNLQYEYVILLESPLAQLHHLVRMAKEHKKKVLLHADMIKGLKHDEHAAQFLCQVIKPAGLISTHPAVIAVAKKHKLIAITRLFLLDSQALETAYRMIDSCAPDYIEVLPGIIPGIAKEINERTGIPIIAGGFIRTMDDIRTVLEAGVTAVSTSYNVLLKSKIIRK